jgi:hypothetical protein
MTETDNMHFFQVEKPNCIQLVLCRYNLLFIVKFTERFMTVVQVIIMLLHLLFIVFIVFDVIFFFYEYVLALYKTDAKNSCSKHETNLFKFSLFTLCCKGKGFK